MAIALGNWLGASDPPDPEAVGELVVNLSGEDATVAEAAAWAEPDCRDGRNSPSCFRVSA